MNHPSDPEEAWLVELLKEEPLPDAGFHQAVSKRISEHLRIRRLCAFAAWLSICLALMSLFPNLIAWLNAEKPGLSSMHFLAVLIGLATFAFFWAAESPEGLQVRKLPQAD